MSVISVGAPGQIPIGAPMFKKDVYRERVPFSKHNGPMKLADQTVQIFQILVQKYAPDAKLWAFPENVAGIELVKVGSATDAADHYKYKDRQINYVLYVNEQTNTYYPVIMSWINDDAGGYSYTYMEYALCDLDAKMKYSVEM